MPWVHVRSRPLGPCFLLTTTHKVLGAMLAMLVFHSLDNDFRSLRSSIVVFYTVERTHRMLLGVVHHEE